MGKTQDKSKTVKGVYPSKQKLYANLTKLTPKAFRVLEELLDSNNENIKLGALKIVLNKAIPDLKATEITGKDGGPIIVNVIEDYLSKPQPVETPA